MTREEAIAYGEDYYRDLVSAVCGVEDKHKTFVKMAIEALHERKSGEWNIKRSKTSGVLFYHCSCCEWCNTHWVKYNYCPNCGARMEGVDE